MKKNLKTKKKTQLDIYIYIYNNSIYIIYKYI